MFTRFRHPVSSLARMTSTSTGRSPAWAQSTYPGQTTKRSRRGGSGGGSAIELRRAGSAGGASGHPPRVTDAPTPYGRYFTPLRRRIVETVWAVIVAPAPILFVTLQPLSHAQRSWLVGVLLFLVVLGIAGTVLQSRVPLTVIDEEGVQRGWLWTRKKIAWTVRRLRRLVALGYGPGLAERLVPHARVERTVPSRGTARQFSH